MEKKKLILLLLSCAVITEAHAAYQGRVYVDSNRNGIYDKGEKVLKGIRVSDGLNVVKTNAEGVYALSRTRTGTIYLHHHSFRL